VAEDGGEAFLGQWSWFSRMKIALVIVVVAAVVAIGLVAKSRSQASSGIKPDSNAKASEPKDVYFGLRNRMLQGSRSKFSLPPTAKPTEPWGVLMDWGVRDGTAAVVAMSDGSASVYLSSGGGYLGGIGQEPIRKAAQNAVEVARGVQLPSQAATDYPLPVQHAVFFYFLTDAGVFVLRTSEKDLGSPTHPLRRVGDAMQGVITEYRLWDQNGRKGGSELRKNPS
jgi:hypothetical protein